MGRQQDAPRAELSRLWRYRLGLSGTDAKYRFVPRSAIVGYDELQATVGAWTGDGDLEPVIRHLWERHGAASPRAVEEFLTTAAELDRQGADATAKRRVLEQWLDTCAPKSRMLAALERVELGVGFVLRRIRQRSFKRPGASGLEPPRTTR